MQLFNKQEYDTMANIVFATDAQGKPRYPGYRPEVVELPNGDGRADTQKRYAHVSLKNLHSWAIPPAEQTPHDEKHWWLLKDYLDRAHAEALRVARALGVPEAFMPDIRYSTLRVLEYPPGATSARHTDPDLFTVPLYRDRAEGLVRYAPPERVRRPARYEAFDIARDIAEYQLRDQIALAREKPFRDLDAISPGLHIGELGEIVGLGPATPHEVVAVSGPGPCRALAPQHSIVYFAEPDHAAVLPRQYISGAWYQDGPAHVDSMTVGQWLDERMARSREVRP